jgi:hypothetical protein
MMPRLPPKLRQQLWRWHDWMIDFSDTRKGRAIMLTVGMAAVVVYVPLQIAA